MDSPHKGSVMWKAFPCFHVNRHNHGAGEKVRDDSWFIVNTHANRATAFAGWLPLSPISIPRLVMHTMMWVYTKNYTPFALLLCDRSRAAPDRHRPPIGVTPIGGPVPIGVFPWPERGPRSGPSLDLNEGKTWALVKRTYHIPIKTKPLEKHTVYRVKSGQPRMCIDGKAW